MSRWFFLVFTLLAFSALAQEPANIIRLSDEKSYTPRAKGLRDLVVDLVNPQLTKQLNDQMIFGHVSEAVFRIYWTAEPERVAMEILGLPAGFNEIKNELKASMIGRLETVIPIPLSKRLTAYKTRTDPRKPGVVIATDPNGQMAILEFELSFAKSGVLEKLVGKKPVGVVTTTYKYEQPSWSDPRLALVSMFTRAEEGPQLVESSSEISYLVTAGMGLPSVVKTTTKQTIKSANDGKPVERTTTETLFMKNYKVNTGAATKWFLNLAAKQ